MHLNLIIHLAVVITLSGKGKTTMATVATVAELLPDAIRTRNLRVLDACVDALRFKKGLNYAQIYEIAKLAHPTLTKPAWESLMYELDEGYF